MHEKVSDEKIISKYDLLFNNLKEGAAVHKIVYDERGVPRDYKFTAVNKQFEKLLKLKTADIVDKLATEVYNTETPPYFDVYSKVAESGNQVEFETYFPPFDMYFQISVFSYRRGTFITLFSDITEKKELVTELKKALDKSEESNRLKSSLLANLSHEFRTPMTGILGMSSILKEKLKDPENLTMLDYVISSGNRLMKTLTALLELVEEESTIKKLKWLNIAESVKEIIEDIKQKAAAKGLEFKSEIEKGLSVFSNNRILYNLFYHLLDNAVKFTEKGRVEISVTAETINDLLWAKIIIKDTGIGISEKDKELVFHEFRQVSEGLSRSFEGVGLGLTLVKKMTELMKGEIFLESKPNEGSTFSVLIPAELSTMADKADEVKTVIIHKASKGKKKLPQILLVEDNLINIKVTEIYLKGLSVLDSASNGLQAIKMASEKQYAMILMDINLGVGMDGVKAAKTIRAIKGYEKTPIVALTGYVMESEKEKLSAAGLTHHLSKPFDKVSLIDFVESVLEESIGK